VSSPKESNKKITAVVLAAGLGSRFQGHKMMHPIDDLPMAIRSALKVKPHADKLVVVVQPNDQELKHALDQHGINYIENPNFKDGMGSSISTAANHLSKNSHLMLCLGDMPFIQELTYTSLIGAFLKSNEEKIVRPVFTTLDKTVPGHPVIFPSHLVSNLMDLKGDTGPKSILKNHQPLLVDTNDEGAIKDIDTL
jgi:molybdenum cofactor cytidylyltransferase